MSKAGSHMSGLAIDMLLWADACTRLPERQVVGKKLCVLDKRVAATRALSVNGLQRCRSLGLSRTREPVKKPQGRADPVVCCRPC